MSSVSQTPFRVGAPLGPPGKPPEPVQGFDVRIHQKTLWLAGTVHSQAEADELIALISALRPMLHGEATPTKQAASGSDESGTPN